MFGQLCVTLGEALGVAAAELAEAAVTAVDDEVVDVVIDDGEE